MKYLVSSPDFSNITTYVAIAVIAMVSVIVSFLAYKLLNKIPAKWLCDYDEVPGEELMGIRYNFKQSGIYTSALFAILNSLAFLFLGWSIYTIFIISIDIVLFLITLSDAKYTIIPDQFIIVLAVFCLGFALTDYFTNQVYITEWWYIPLGAVCGGGILFLINIISILILKKPGMGFGDVKLMLALGCCTGFPLIFAALLLSVLVAFIYIIFTLIKKALSKNEVDSYFPFGPFLCIGTTGALIFVNQICSFVDWYVSLLTV